MSKYEIRNKDVKFGDKDFKEVFLNAIDSSGKYGPVAGERFVFFIDKDGRFVAHSGMEDDNIVRAVKFAAVNNNMEPMRSHSDFIRVEEELNKNGVVYGRCSNGLFSVITRDGFTSKQAAKIRELVTVSNGRRLLFNKFLLLIPEKDFFFGLPNEFLAVVELLLNDQFDDEEKRPGHHPKM